MKKKLKNPLKTYKFRETSKKEVSAETIMKHAEELRNLFLESDPHHEDLYIPSL